MATLTKAAVALSLSMTACCTQASAAVLGLDYSAFTVSKIMCNRDYLVPDVDCSEWRGAVALDADFGTSAAYPVRLMLRNQVHGEGTEAKFKTIGWKYEVALTAPSLGLEIGWAHHSRHALDQEQPHAYSYDYKYEMTKFPIYDAVFLRFVLTEKKR